MLSRRLAMHLIAAFFDGFSLNLSLFADEPPRRESHPKRILLLGQKPDSHPKSTHEYMPGNRIIARLLQGRHGLQVIVVQADDPWNDGPELLDGADGVVIFLTEGAQWISDNPERLTAFQRFAKRGGGLTCLHWGMGTRESMPVDSFVELFGGCHGGLDRKYKVGDFQLTMGSKPHPITSGIVPFTIHDELYYALNFPRSKEGHTTLLQARIGDRHINTDGQEWPSSRFFFAATLAFHVERWVDCE